MTRLVLKDELLDAQLLRAIGAAPYGGADIGECIQTARAINEKSLDSWHAQWLALAQRTKALAESAAGVAARQAYLRACTYYRTAGVMLLARPADERLVASNLAQTQMFRAAAVLMDQPVETVEIPYEGTTLPGYFMRPDRSGVPRPTVLLVGGYDGTCEELYFFNGAAALARGYNVLALDGPGQGAALLQQGLVLRPDWESVITPAVDWLVSRPETDASRIGLIGLSLGAHLAPRAAAREHRITALVADCGSYDLRASFLDRIPRVLRTRATRPVLAALLRMIARRPTVGWALRRGQLAHGCPSPLAYLDALGPYRLDRVAAEISCPTWICNAEGDDVGATAPRLVEALTCDKTYVHFTAAEGAGDHCEQGARTLYHARSFDWLDSVLHPT